MRLLVEGHATTQGWGNRTPGWPGSGPLPQGLEGAKPG